MIEWHPVTKAFPIEWIVEHPVYPPWGVIRKLEFRDNGDKSTWYRAVTWSDDPAQRQLIGYATTLEDAARAIWDHALAERKKSGQPTHASPQRTNR